MIFRSFWPPEQEVRGSQHERAHALLHRVLTAWGISPQEQTLGVAQGGKPYLLLHPELAVNLTHCSGGCAVALAPRGQLGVDMERIRPFRPDVVRRFFSPQEQAYMAQSADPDRDFFRLWTLKESYIKALGSGLAYPLAKAGFQLDRDGKILSHPEGAVFQQYEDVSGYLAATCLLL